MQNEWSISAGDDYLSARGDVLRYGVIKLQSWPDLSKVPELLQPLVARICALLSRKPSASRMVPLVLSAPEGDVMRAIAALVSQGHVVVATSAFADSQSAAVEEVAPQVQEPAPVVSRFSAVRKSLVGKLWQKFMS